MYILTVKLLPVKFGANICNSDRDMAIKVKFQNGGCRRLGFRRVKYDGKIICFRDVILSPFAKFSANMCKIDRVMAV